MTFESKTLGSNAMSQKTQILG